MRYQLTENADQKWTWQLVSRSGEVLMLSETSFPSSKDAWDAVVKISAQLVSAPIVDRSGEPFEGC